MEGSTLGGDRATDSRTNRKRYRRTDTEARFGDVDLNGDLVDRLRSAIGDCVYPIDPEAHARSVALEITRAKAASR